MVSLRATLSLQPDRVGFVVEKGDTGTGFLHVLWFSPKGVILPRLHTHSFTYHRQFMNLSLLCAPTCSQVTVQTGLSILLSFSANLTSFCNHCWTVEFEMCSKFLNCIYCLQFCIPHWARYPFVAKADRTTWSSWQYVIGNYIFVLNFHNCQTNDKFCVVFYCQLKIRKYV